MTVPISDRLSQLYVGNGTNTRFDFTFRVFDQEDTTGIAVRKKGSADFETVDPSTYAVTINPDNMGGYIIFNSPPVAGMYFYIAGATPLDQLLDITNYDNFYPDAIERALDKLTALLQEWGTQLDLEKQARILADIHYDSLAMEREDNLENRLVTYINAIVGITNPKIFDGISDRMVITKDGRTQREFNDSLPFWTNDYANFKQETIQRENKIVGFVIQEDEKLSTTFNSKLSAETERAMAAEAEIDAKTNANGVGNRAYKTYAKMDADKTNIPAKSKVTVTNDPTSSNNGDWQWDGSSFTKSAYDPISQANAYTDEKTKKLDNVIEQDIPYSISDGAGRRALAILEDGTVKTAEIDTNALTVAGAKIKKDDVVFAVSDKDGEHAFALKTDGTLLVGSVDSKEIKLNGKDISSIVGQVRKIGHFAYNIVHFEIFGQSLSQGAYSSPIQTTTQKFDNIMFVGGIRPQHPSYNVPNFFESFIPLVEAKDISGYVGYETPCGGATDCVKQLINDENGIEYTQQKYQLLGSACGEGGMSLASLSTTYLNNNLKPAITNAFNLAQAQGLTYGMPLMGWVQGEEDNKPGVGTTIQQYKDGLQNLIGLVDAHLKTLNSDLALDGLITTQLCSFKTSGRTEPHIELAIYQAATEANSNIYLACPLYIFDYADGYHINGVSSNWMGAYIGLVHKRVLVDGEDWKPVHPISSVRQGKIAEIRFHVPVQPLVFDTTHVALNTNYGFTLVDSANNPLSISSVAITQGDAVKIVAVDPIPAGAKLRYAWTPSARPNRSTGPRGNLRDSQGNDLVFDPEGINKPLHNWCPIFEYVIN